MPTGTVSGKQKLIISSNYWSLELRIPVSTITFKSGLHTWGFNVERRIQRLMEVDRWSGSSRDYKLAQTINCRFADRSA